MPQSTFPFPKSSVSHWHSYTKKKYTSIIQFAWHSNNVAQPPLLPVTATPRSSLTGLSQLSHSFAKICWICGESIGPSSSGSQLSVSNWHTASNFAATSSMPKPASISKK